MYIYIYKCVSVSVSVCLCVCVLTKNGGVDIYGLPSFERPYTLKNPLLNS